MSDLVERLRAMGAAQRPHIGDEAADEIERLQKRNALLEDIAVAAENMTYADAVAGAETWGEMKQVLDKLREVGDE
jgi:uncharacterized protein YfeS